MKNQITIWRTPPKLRRSDIAWTLVPALLWGLALQARPFLIHPHCVTHPEKCTIESLWPVDRPAVGLEAGKADGLSFITQGLSAVLALGAPPLWHLGTVALGAATPLAALAAAGTDLVIFTQTTMWNGLFTETSHLVAQRPRPFVYADPARAGDFSNYTSFYSGHTSFTAAATIFLLLTIAGRSASRWPVVLSAVVSYSLVSATGLYRVLAGRHFPTDVLTGALAGACIAILIALRHRRPSGA